MWKETSSLIFVRVALVCVILDAMFTQQVVAQQQDLHLQQDSVHIAGRWFDGNVRLLLHDASNGTTFVLSNCTIDGKLMIRAQANTQLAPTTARVVLQDTVVRKTTLFSATSGAGSLSFTGPQSGIYIYKSTFQSQESTLSPLELEQLSLHNGSRFLLQSSVVTSAISSQDLPLFKMSGLSMTSGAYAVVNDTSFIIPYLSAATRILDLVQWTSSDSHLVIITSTFNVVDGGVSDSIPTSVVVRSSNADRSTLRILNNTFGSVKILSVLLLKESAFASSQMVLRNNTKTAESNRFLEFEKCVLAGCLQDTYLALGENVSPGSSESVISTDSSTPFKVSSSAASSAGVGVYSRASLGTFVSGEEKDAITNALVIVPVTQCARVLNCDIFSSEGATALSLNGTAPMDCEPCRCNASLAAQYDNQLDEECTPVDYFFSFLPVTTPPATSARYVIESATAVSGTVNRTSLKSLCEAKGGWLAALWGEEDFTAVLPSLEAIAGKDKDMLFLTAGVKDSFQSTSRWKNVMRWKSGRTSQGDDGENAPLFYKEDHDVTPHAEKLCYLTRGFGVAPEIVSRTTGCFWDSVHEPDVASVATEVCVKQPKSGSTAVLSLCRMTDTKLYGVVCQMQYTPSFTRTLTKEPTKTLAPTPSRTSSRSGEERNVSISVTTSNTGSDLSTTVSSTRTHSVSKNSASSSETPSENTPSSTTSLTVAKYRRSNTKTHQTSSVSPSVTPSFSVTTSSSARGGTPTTTSSRSIHRTSLTATNSYTKTLSSPPTATSTLPLLCFAEEVRRLLVAVDGTFEQQVVPKWFVNTDSAIVEKGFVAERELSASESAVLHLALKGNAENTSYMSFSKTLALVQQSSVKVRPNPEGFSKYSTDTHMDIAVLAVQQEGGSSDAAPRVKIHLTLPPISEYTIVEDEVVEVTLLLRDLCSCATEKLGPTMASESFRLLRLQVTAPEDAVVESTKTAAQAVGITTAVSSLAVAPGGAVMDQQSAAIIGLLSCADPYERKMLGNYRLLGPTATSDSFLGIIYGNVMFMVGASALHLAICAIYVKAKGVSWPETFGRLKFPSVPYKILVVTYQGTAFASVQVLARADNSTSFVVRYGVGGTAAFFTLFVVPCFLVLYAVRFIACEYGLYDFSSYKRLPRFPQWFFRLVMPAGRWWNPPIMRKIYGSYFTAYQRPEYIWTSSIVWSSLIMAVGSGVTPTDPTNCIIQYIILAVLQGGLAVIVLVLQPFRSILANIFSALSTGTLCIILIGSGFSITQPRNETAKSVIPAAAQLQMAVSILRIIHAFFIWILERSILRGGELETVFTWVPRTSLDNSSRMRRSFLIEDATVLADPLLNVAATTEATKEEEHSGQIQLDSFSSSAGVLSKSFDPTATKDLELGEFVESSDDDGLGSFNSDLNLDIEVKKEKDEIDSLLGLDDEDDNSDFDISATDNPRTALKRRISTRKHGRQLDLHTEIREGLSVPCVAPTSAVLCRNDDDEASITANAGANPPLPAARHHTNDNQYRSTYQHPSPPSSQDIEMASFL